MKMTGVSSNASSNTFVQHAVSLFPYSQSLFPPSFGTLMHRIKLMMAILAVFSHLARVLLATTSSSLKQKIPSKSSTESELIGLNDKSGDILWTRHFLVAQGYTISSNIVFQDNMSTLSLAKNQERICLQLQMHKTHQG